ncbi:imelysin family protein [Marinobacter bohaiensis]|uniref:imelysin family protein n=1 Tax=Marinobacter bohaiensis TaxID=2201898 RepID=UPI000DAD40FA|nr:imelysin family protein [Marinobacter bohaiensis]
MPAFARPGRPLLAAVFGAFALTAQAADTPRDTWYAAFQSGYDALAASAQTLQQSATAYCDAPDDTGRARLVADWRAAFLDWQAIRFVDFGPIEQDSRAWQIQFWPDAKNLVARKVSYALKQENAAVQDLVDDSGVALQGFPAIEYLLYDPAMQDGDDALPAANTCLLLTAIGGHLELTTATLAEDWRAFGNFYRQQDRYEHRTVEAALNGLEILQDRRLADPMGLRGNTRHNPYLGDAWRSGQSLAAIQASIEGLDRYFKPGLQARLTAAGHADLAQRLDQQLQNTLDEFQALPTAMAPLLDDEAGYAQLQSLYIEVTQLEQVLAGRIAPALGVTRGFNASDGD